MVTLSIGLSTVSDNRDRALGVAKSIVDSDDSGLIFEVLIVCQKSAVDRVTSPYERIRLLEVRESGLSRSRNLAVAEAKGEFLWFIDDDVDVDAVCLQVLKRELPIEGVLLGRIGCVDGDGFYKDYSRRFSLPLSLLRVSSIEIVVNRRLLLDSGVRFDERLGLGGLFPCSEENAFAIDLYKKGFRFKVCEEIIVRHPCSAHERRDYFALPSQMTARGIAARRLGLLVGTPLCFYWAFRVFRRPNSLPLIKAMFQGLISG